MQLIIDLSSGSVSLGQRDDLERFSVLALASGPDDEGFPGALGAVAAALSVHDAGTVDPEGTCSIPPDVIRRLAHQGADEEGESLPGEWDARFADMVEGAAEQGWIGEDGSVRAHIDWSSS